jgi:hypothetical protein
MGSSPSRHSVSSKSLSVMGHGSQKSGARSSNSPSSRHRKKISEVPKQKQSHKDKVLYARSSFNSRPRDDLNVMTIFSVKAVDRGVNTDPIPGVTELSVFNADEIDQNSSVLELSMLSFPDSAPPKSRGTAIKESTYAHFPELGLPSSPYAHRPAEPVADRYTVTELRSSPNALVTLYNIYWQHIPSVFRARLLSTASSRSEFISSRDSLTFLFEPIEKEMEKIDVCLASAIKGTEYCLRLTQSLIIVGEEQRLSDKYKDSLGQLFRNIAELEVTAVWSEIQLEEYKAMFHKIHAMGISNLSDIIRRCPPYGMSKNLYLNCERNVVSFAQFLYHFHFPKKKHFRKFYSIRSIT